MQQEICMRPRRLGWNEADYQIETPLRDEKGRSVKGKNKTGEKKGIIPLFFATDDNYLPFLSVTLQSLRENSSLDYDYKIYVLHSGVRKEFEEKIMHFSQESFEVTFTDVTEPLKEISAYLRLRDYYTCTTYFRVFIAQMFPQYDKALYLDCDTVILGDISALYNYDLGDNLIAGAPCEGVNSFEVYREYNTISVQEST